MRVLKHLSQRLRGLLAVAFVTLSFAPNPAYSLQVGSVRAELIADQDQVVAGQPLRVGLHLRHNPEWHTYWVNPGDSGLPTQFPLALPAGFSAGEIEWPRPSRFLIPPLANLGYDRDIVLVRDVRVPEQLIGQAVRFETTAQWLVCREVCVPGEAKLSLTLPVASAAESTDKPTGQHRWLFDDAAKQVPASPRPVTVARVGDALHIHIAPEFVSTRAARIEFFAQHPEQVNHAAPQRLFRLANEKGWRLEVPLASAVKEAGGGADIGKAGTGVLVFDDSLAAQTIGKVGEADSFGGGKSLGDIRGHELPFLAAQQGAASGLLAALGQSKPRPTGSTLAPNSDGSASATPAVPAAAQSTNPVTSVAMGMLFAMIGGLILNLMPCVFPVIGLKILGFAGEGASGSVSLSHEQRSRVRRGCFWFAFGVVTTFLALALVLLGLRSAGQAIGWGFQLQSPPFVALMALLFVAIGLNFVGLFEVGTGLTRLGQHDGASTRATRATLSGVLAVLVATPCTAPFMGGALGYTLSLPVTDTLLIYAALGIGMALPYVVLGVLPGWLRWLPRPGRWMQTLREFLSFPMFAAAAWLTWVLGQQVGIDGVVWLLMGIVLLTLALWLYGRFVQNHRANAMVWTPLAIVLGIGSIALAWPVQPQAELAKSAVVAQDGWQNWSAPRVAQHLQAGKPVFIDFTAAWCVSCQVNKKLVLNTPSVQAAFDDAGVQRFRADWTNQDAAVTAELARHGRNSVPLYLLYFPDGKPPRVLPELLTESAVLSALRQR